MKKLFSVLVLVLVPVILIGQTVSKSADNFWGPQDDHMLKMNKHVPSVFDPKGFVQDEVQGTKIVDRIRDSYFSYQGNVTPIVYEPISGTLALLQHDRTFPTTGNPFGTIYMIYSTDGGNVWSSKVEILRKDNTIPVWASLGMVNLNGTKNPLELVYFVTSVVAVNEAGSYPYKGHLYVYKNGSDVQNETIFGPGTSLYRWWQTKSTSFSGNQEGFVYNIGTLANTEGQQYGRSGFTGYFLDSEGYQLTTNSGMPNKWSQTIVEKSTSINSSSNVVPRLDVDDKGNVYAAFHNFFNEDSDNRVVGVSKSTNYGDTWENFDLMPYSLVPQFASSQGSLIDNINFYGPTGLLFGGDAFVVTGENEYSYFYKILTSTDGDTYTGAHIVEAYSKNGVWNMRKVADFDAFPQQLTIEDVSTDDNVTKDSLMTGYYGIQLQAAKTADGSKIVVKWVASVDKPIVVNPAFVYQVLDENQQPANVSVDTLYTNDIFLAYREVGGNLWADAVNTTNDDQYNKLSHMPQVIPNDITKVPVTHLKVAPFTNQQYYRYNYAEIIKQLCNDPGVPHDVQLSLLDATGNSTSVEEEVSEFGSLELRDIFPNPVAKNFVEIGFNLPSSTTTRIELFNSLGQRVKLIQQGAVDAGFNVVMLNTNELESGVYYYTLTAFGKTLTKILTVNN